MNGIVRLGFSVGSFGWFFRVVLSRGSLFPVFLAFLLFAFLVFLVRLWEFDECGDCRTRLSSGMEQEAYRNLESHLLEASIERGLD